MPYTQIQPEQIIQAAIQHDLVPCCLQAVCSIESNGKAFHNPGQPTILFEGHIFWRQLAKRKINPLPLASKHPTLVFPRRTRKHYGKTKHTSMPAFLKR